jgi:hypothetical protein
VKLGGQAVDEVRRRVQQTIHGHRGGKQDGFNSAVTAAHTVQGRSHAIDHNRAFVRPTMDGQCALLAETTAQDDMRLSSDCASAALAQSTSLNYTLPNTAAGSPHEACSSSRQRYPECRS